MLLPYSSEDNGLHLILAINWNFKSISALDVQRVERPTADWRLCEFLGFLELRRQIFHRRRQQPSPQPGIRHTEQPERRLAPTGKSNTLVPAPTWQMYSGACTDPPGWHMFSLMHPPGTCTQLPILRSQHCLLLFPPILVQFWYQIYPQYKEKIAIK